MATNASYTTPGGTIPLFFGDGLRVRRIASYAASFGNYDAAEGLASPWSEWLGRFMAIAVRDENSRRLLSGAIRRKPAITLDPCLQFPPSSAPAETGVSSPYVAVYGHSFAPWFAEAVHRAARRRGGRLMSVGYRNDFADEEHLTAGPAEFAGLLGGACAVATNFFHGCIFALLNAKPFVCAASAYRFNKVRDLASLLGAQGHVMREQDDPAHIDDRLGMPPSAALVARVAGLRRSSSDYLAHVLG